MKLRNPVLSAFCAAIVIGMAACSHAPAENADTSGAGASSEQANSKGSEKLEPEKDGLIHIKWAQGTSGNGFVTVGNKLGYFKEEGVAVDEIPMEDNPAAGLTAAQVDIVSNDGTNTPLQQIAAGDDISIFGGHMLTGCMPIIAKKGTEWKGIESFIGKKIACPPNQFSLTGPLLKLGYDPLKECEWISYPTQSDRVAAVVSGECDYGVIGTGQMFTILGMDDIEILAYMSDITPNYSCCRLFTRTGFMNDNKEAFKKLCKGLLRAQAYYEANKEEVVKMMAEQMSTTEEYVSAYMLNEHYRINADPIKNKVVDAWNILDQTGFLDENSKKINVEEHINTEIYKEALDEIMADPTLYNEHKDFYDRQLEFFNENNL